MSEAEPAAKTPEAPEAPARTAPRIGARVLAFLGSYGLAVTLLAILLVITFLGTLEQRHSAIYDVQKKYFESVFHVSRTLNIDVETGKGGIPIPLPGAMPVLMLLAINLVVGGLVRMRKGKNTIGIFVTHIGIALLLLGGMVEFIFSREGTMSIRPGESNDAYVSYHDWDVVVSEFLDGGAGREFVITQDKFETLDDGDAYQFRHKDLPFTVDLSGYVRNCMPVNVGSASQMGDIEGWLLRRLDLDMKAERNTPGMTATIRDADAKSAGPRAKPVLLWGLTTGPHLFEWRGRKFGIDLQRQRYELPFKLRLTRFDKIDHPGIDMAREYSSYVQMVEGGAIQDIHITMNEPLRHRGYIFYQSSYDPVRGADNKPIRDEKGRIVYLTVLTVSENPADRIPLIACIVITLGLLIHFTMKLTKHVTAEGRRQARAAA